MLSPLPWTPPGLTLTRSGRARLAVADEDVELPLVSPGTRLVASEEKATKRPSAEIAGSSAAAIALGAARPDAHPLGRARLAVADEHVGHAVGVARHQVGGVRLKATKRPSAEIAGLYAVPPLPWTPPGPRLTRRVVSSAWRSPGRCA